MIYIFQLKCNPGYLHRTPHSLSWVLIKYNIILNRSQFFVIVIMNMCKVLILEPVPLKLEVFLVFPSLSGLSYVSLSLGLIFESQSWYLIPHHLTSFYDVVSDLLL
jgi:hypothetical protein